MIGQIFNFIDMMGGMQELNLANLDKFLKSKGILDLGITGEVNQKSLGKELKDPKDSEFYYMGNMSSYLNESQLDEQHVNYLNNKVLRVMNEERQEVELEHDDAPYKNTMLEAFRAIADPFGVEFLNKHLPGSLASFHDDMLDANQISD